MWDLKHKRQRFLVTGFLIVLIGTNLITYYMFGHKPSTTLPPARDPGTDYQESLNLSEELAMFEQVLMLLSEHYLDPVDLPVLVRGAIRGAVEAVGDPRTTFYDLRELENFRIHTTGSFGGIGVRIVEVGDSVVVFETIPGTPAERAGLYPGDRIRSAAGVDLTGQGVDRAMELLRGSKGTTVTIVVERPGAEEPISLTLERDEIKIVTVTSRMLEPGLGYIQISSFDSSTGSAFTEQLIALEAEGLDRGLILDLRNNTGGLVEEAIKVARLLVPEGEITRLVGRDGQVKDIHYSSAPPKPYPLVVLVNEESASAAEIVAGALQDRGAAPLVGAKTYGKATVQHLELLPGGNALLLTVAKYLTPSGRDIHGRGLEPDYPVELSAALKYYRYFLPGRLERGNYGVDVKLLQDMLAELGYSVSGTGFFDEATAVAMAGFQVEKGLDASGVFDDRTWLELREALDKTVRERDPQFHRAVELIRQQD